MKKLFQYATVLTIASTTILACSGTKKISRNLPTAKTGTSLLWEITGNGLKQPSYLYGTIHVIDSASFVWSQTYQKAFNSVKRLVLEVNISKSGLTPSPALIQGMMLKDNKTLKDLFPPKQFDSLQTKLQAMGIPMMMMNRFEPLFTQQMVVMAKQKKEKKDMVSYEMYLTNMAKAKKYKTDGLETFKEQLEIIDSIPVKKQAQMLYQTVMNVSQSRLQLKKLVSFYRAQQLDSLGAMINGKSGMTTGKNLLLTDRNKRWISKIEKFMSDSATFFAVGAGHLPDKIGLIHLLREQGYKLRPIQAKGSAIQTKFLNGLTSKMKSIGK